MVAFTYTIVYVLGDEKRTIIKGGTSYGKNFLTYKGAEKQALNECVKKDDILYFLDKDNELIPVDYINVWEINLNEMGDNETLEKTIYTTRDYLDGDYPIGGDEEEEDARENYGKMCYSAFMEKVKDAPKWDELEQVQREGWIAGAVKIALDKYEYD